MIKINFLSTVAVASLVLFAPSMILAKGDSGKAAKEAYFNNHHNHYGDYNEQCNICNGDHGKSGKHGGYGKSGKHGGHGKSGKHGGHGKSGKHGGHGKSGKSGGVGTNHPNSCTPCKGGLSAMTLRNDGASGTVNISGKKGGHLFSEDVGAGDTFTYQSYGKMDHSIFINGADIHTSCSRPIYAGMKVGNFTLVSATSAQSGEVLCSLPVDPPEASTGKVCGIVFHDENGNGRQDDDEVGTRGIVVSILDSNGETKTSKTRATGSYCVSNVSVGDATVSVKESTLPANSELTVGSNPSDVTVVGNKRNDAGKDGYVFPQSPAGKTGKVCGSVFNDVNNNKRKDAGEKGVANIAINIVAENGDVVKGKTRSSGYYCISDVPKGSAEVTVVKSTLPDGAKLTSGTNPTDVTVVPNQKNNAGKDGYSTGENPPSSTTGKVCGSLFNDENHNGKKDAGEQGVANIAIKIVAANGDVIKGKTKSSGSYCISDVPKGSAEVTVVTSTLPDGAKLTSGTNPTDVKVVPDQRNKAGKDGYVIGCDCSICNK